MSVNKLVIDRALWGKYSLKNEVTGKMCCLGHLSLACGVPASELIDQNGARLMYPLPDWLYKYNMPVGSTYDPRPVEPWPAVDGGFNLSFANHASIINDNVKYSSMEKESLLIKLFAKNGIELSFTGESTPDCSVKLSTD